MDTEGSDNCILVDWLIGDFLKEDKPVYEDITDFKKLKSFMEANLEDYNNEPGFIAMDLVLFRDAIEHGITMPFGCSTTLYLLSSYSNCTGYSTAEGEHVIGRYWW